MAAAFGSAELVRLLHQSGASMVNYNSEGNAPIHIACKHDNIDGLTALIEYRAESQVNITNWQGHKPIHVACIESTRLEIIQALIARGASIEATTSESHTPLQLAISNKKWTFVERLLAFGADINGGENIEDRDHLETPLSLAFDAHNKSLASQLLSRGVNVNAAGPNSRKTLIHYLAEDLNADKVEFLEELLSAGGDASTIDKDGYQPLHYVAMSKSSHQAVGIELLISHGANISAISYRGVTPLYLAMKRYDLELVELLVHHGARKLPTKQSSSIRIAMIQEDMAEDAHVIYCLQLSSYQADHRFLFESSLATGIPFLRGQPVLAHFRQPYRKKVYDQERV